MGSAEAIPRTAFAEGVPCWTDAMLPDLEAGKRFYGALFGWTYGDPAPPARDSYTVAYLDGERVAALAHKPDGRLPTAWTVYFATSDAAAAAGRVRAAGGQLVTEPVPVGRAGTMATAVDPGGAAFGLWQAGALTGFLATRRPGAYVWTELFTRERETVDAFYTAVFGYGMYPAGGAGTTRTAGEGTAGNGDGAADGGSGDGGPETGAETGGEAPELMVWVPAGEPADDEHAVGDRTMIDDTYPVEMPAHFLVYFAVADCDAAARTTVRLGGRVVEEPRDTPFGRHAVLVDNQGARFGVLAPAEPVAEPAADAVTDAVTDAATEPAAAEPAA
ncbi:VOC family protein [Streptomyces sp. TRM 70361]|uniref:VOC family protein n=1 Tax=Streptomyces sp. TRM 70361 TaxID=3116553 RepID=UPI002E7C540C|nr:VOC family protein [Streptomyces sp. TRM 70361]MEE1938378.1 VOC family protein [Streptomyces sp. TRM 70361]